MRQYQKWLCVPVLCLAMQLFGCDAANEAEDTGPDGATPTTAVGQAIGMTNQLVSEDTFNVAEEISANTLIALQSVYEFEDPERGDRIQFQLMGAVNQNAINDIYNFETETGTLAIEALAVELTKDGAAANTWPGEDCSDVGECSCNSGGSRVYTGTLDISVDTESLSGEINGSYDITYNDCIELVTLNVTDVPCVGAVKLNGTISQTVAIAFSNFTESASFDEFSTTADREIFQATATAGVAPLSFSNAASATGTFTAEDSVDLDFNYTYGDGSALIEPDGLITFDGVEYNMVLVQDFIEDSTNEAVCP